MFYSKPTVTFITRRFNHFTAMFPHPTGTSMRMRRVKVIFYFNPLPNNLVSTRLLEGDFWKHFGKKEKILWPIFSSFPIMFSMPTKTNSILSVSLSSTSPFNTDARTFVVRYRVKVTRFYSIWWTSQTLYNAIVETMYQFFHRLGDLLFYSQSLVFYFPDGNIVTHNIW